jgi:hypothetical protein
MEKNIVEVKGIDVSYKRINGEDYICLTDIARAKNPKHSGQVINNWLRNSSTLDYLGLWETLTNANFKVLEFEYFKNKCRENSYVLTVQEWIEKTSAIGIICKSGRYGGTYAHKDIAFKFASWISVEFELYLIKEFQRLKEQEYKSLEWSAKRELAKVNYHIHTSSIKENLIVPQLSKEQIYYTYASEADLLNVALFGITASEWRSNNKELKGNIRDYASIEQLLILANMESYNAMLIEQGLDSKDRIVLLNNMAKSQMKVLLSNNSKLLVKE